MLARAALVLAVATITFLLLWHFALRRYLTSTAGPRNVSPTIGANPAPTILRNSSAAQAAVPVPLTAAQQKAAALSTAREPFFSMLVNQSDGAVGDAEADQLRPSTLIVHMTTTSQAAQVISRIIVPYADQYGFNHARIYVPQDSTTGGAYRLAYELDHPASQGWITFAK